MAFFTGTKTVQSFAGALYGVQVGSTLMAEVNRDIDRNGLNQTLNTYFNASFGSELVATTAAKLVASLGITTGSAEAIAYVVGKLTPAGAAKGEAIAKILQDFSSLTGDATYGAAAKAWNAKVDAATAYKGTDTQAMGSGAVYQLSVSLDDVVGSAGADMFYARVVQNDNGEQTNQLATGDSIDGGAGDDTLVANVQMASGLNGAPQSAIRAITEDVENALFTALTVDNSNAPGAASEVVTINAAEMIGLNLVGSVDSDASLVIQNLNTLKDDGIYADRRNTQDVTIRMDHSGNDMAVDDASDLTVLFDNDFLVSGASSTSTLELRLVNNLELAKNSKPLVGFTEVAFSVGSTVVAVPVTQAIRDATGAAAYTALAAAVTARLTALNITDVTISVLPARAVYFSDDVGTFQANQLAGTYSPIQVVSTGATLTKGQTALDNTTNDFNGLNTQTDTFASQDNPITSTVQLYKVGRGGEGGELVIGGMATDMANKLDFTDNAIEEGVQVFKVTVEGDQTQFSSLAAMHSTNNTLEQVNVGWKTGSVADLIIGNHNTKAVTTVTRVQTDDPTDPANSTPGTGRQIYTDVTSEVLANGAEPSGAGITNRTTTYNNALKDVRVFEAINSNSKTTANGAVFTNDVTLHAHLSDEVVAKYMDRKDNISNPATDNANFVYSFGSGNDTLNLNISKANLAASGTTNREDFSLAINTGAGNDTVVVQIGNGTTGAASALENWYVNSNIDKNLNIDTGAGNDTIRTNAGGSWTVVAGAGDDAIYSDNSGRLANTTFNEGRAVWVINEAATAGNAEINNLLSNVAVTTTSKVANLSLKLTYRGLEVTVQVGDTHTNLGQVVTDLVINNAIKKAISSDVYLKNLLVAEDGPGRTLIIRSLTDGVFANTDLSLALSSVAATTAQTDNGVITYVSTAFDLGVQLADEATVNLVGAKSVVGTGSTITAGTGLDTVVLSTSGISKETVNVSNADKDVVFNATNAAITADINDIIITSAGAKVTGANGAVTVGGTGALTITGSAGDETIIGTAGNDIITGGAGADKITLVSGTDSVIVASDATGAGTATAGSLTAGVAIGTSTLSFASTAMDVITNFADGDTVQLYTTGTTAITTSTTLLTAASTWGAATVGDVALVRGNNAAGVFTASTTGADSALIWDTNGTTAAGSYGVVILVGYTDGGTDTISAAGLFTGA
jgi:hypothetical protein